MCLYDTYMRHWKVYLFLHKTLKNVFFYLCFYLCWYQPLGIFYLCFQCYVPLCRYQPPDFFHWCFFQCYVPLCRYQPPDFFHWCFFQCYVPLCRYQPPDFFHWCFFQCYVPVCWYQSPDFFYLCFSVLCSSLLVPISRFFLLVFFSAMFQFAGTNILKYFLHSRFIFWKRLFRKGDGCSCRRRWSVECYPRDQPYWNLAYKFKSWCRLADGSNEWWQSTTCSKQQVLHWTAVNKPIHISGGRRWSYLDYISRVINDPLIKKIQGSSNHKTSTRGWFNTINMLGHRIRWTILNQH